MYRRLTTPNRTHSSSTWCIAYCARQILPCSHWQHCSVEVLCMHGSCLVTRRQWLRRCVRHACEARGQLQQAAEFSQLAWQCFLPAGCHMCWTATVMPLENATLTGLDLPGALLCCFCRCQQGWGENDRGVSYTFGPDCVTDFLQRHDLDLVCRAHQVGLLLQALWSPLVATVCLCWRVVNEGGRLKNRLHAAGWWQEWCMLYST